MNSWFHDKSGEIAIHSVHKTICYTVVCDRCFIEMIEILTAATYTFGASVISSCCLF